MTYNLQPSYPNVSELTTQDKAISVVYGRRSSDGELVPVAIDDTGRILLGSGITLDAGDLNIGSVEIQDNDSSTRVDVIRIGDPISLPPFSGGSDNFAGFLVLGKDNLGAATPLSFDSSGNLKVSITSAITSSNNIAQWGGVATSLGQKTSSSSVPVVLASDQSIIPVVLTPAGSEIYIYGEQLAVASSATVPLVTYTVPVGKIFYLKHIEASGENIGVYVVTAAAATVATRRTNYTIFNTDFIFDSGSSGLLYNAGDVITVTAMNDGMSSATFNGTIYGQLV